MQNTQTTRHCKKCNLVKQISEFPIAIPGKEWRRHECQTCYYARLKVAHEANREHRKAKMRERYAKDPTKYWYPERREKANIAARLRSAKLRDTVIAKYGAKCACCGERELLFLTLDHVNNNGKQMRQEVHGNTSPRLYKWVIENNYPDSIQILCMNCNWGKARNGGVCPHIK